MAHDQRIPGGRRESPGGTGHAIMDGPTAEQGQFMARQTWPSVAPVTSGVATALSFRACPGKALAGQGALAV